MKPFVFQRLHPAEFAVEYLCLEDGALGTTREADLAHVERCASLAEADAWVARTDPGGRWEPARRLAAKELSAGRPLSWMARWEAAQERRSEAGSRRSEVSSQ